VITLARHGLRSIAATRVQAFAALLAVSFPWGALAEEESNWSLNTGVSRSDNVTRAETDAQPETILSVGGTIDVKRDGTRADLSLNVDAHALHYVDGIFDDEVIGSGTLGASFGIVPEAFEWKVNDNFGQSVVETLLPATPENRENVNVFSTGPDIAISLASATTLRFDARIGSSIYERTQSDSQSLRGNLALERELSANNHASFNLRAARVEFPDIDNGGYDQQEAFVSWVGKGSRTELSLDLGAGVVHDGGDSKSSPIARLDLTRHISKRLSMELSGGVEFISPSERFVRLQESSPDSTEPIDIELTQQALREDRVDFGIEYAQSRTQFRMQASFGVERYEQEAGPDRDHSSFSANFERLITPRISASIFARYERRKFDASGAEDRTTTAGFLVDLRLLRTISLQLGLDSSRREADGTAVAGYEEQRAGLIVTYSPRIQR